eukprot:EG_transcript_843
MALLRTAWPVVFIGLVFFFFCAEAQPNASNTTNATNTSSSNMTNGSTTNSRNPTNPTNGTNSSNTIASVNSTNATNLGNATNSTNTTGLSTATSPSPTNASTNASALLALQNQRRCLHRAPPLQWSATLAAAAAGLALQWLSQPPPLGYGLNSWLGPQVPDPQQVVDTWYAEIAWYNFAGSGPPANGTTSSPGFPAGGANATNGPPGGPNGTNGTAVRPNATNGTLAGPNATNGTAGAPPGNGTQTLSPAMPSPNNFTQLVWRNTTQVGCGTSVLNGTYLLVCLYNVSGNVPGQYQDNVQPVSRGQLECGPRRPCEFSAARVQQLLTALAADYANQSSNLTALAAAWLPNGTYYDDGLYSAAPAQGSDLIRAAYLARRRLAVQRGLQGYALQLVELQNSSGVLRAAAARNVSWNGTWTVEGPELYTLYCNDSLGQWLIQSLDTRTGLWAQVSPGNPQGGVLRGPRTLDPDCRGSPGQAVPMKCCGYTTSVLAPFGNRTVCPSLSSINSTYFDFSISCAENTFQFGRQCGAFCQCKSVQSVPAKTCVLLEDSTQQNVYAMFDSCPGLFSAPPAPSAAPQGQVRYAPTGQLDPACVAAPGQPVPPRCCQAAPFQLAAFDGQGSCFQPDPQRPFLTFGLTCQGGSFTFGDLCRANCTDCDLVYKVGKPGCVALKGVPGYSYFGQFDSCLGKCDLSTIVLVAPTSSLPTWNLTSNSTQNGTLSAPNTSNSSTSNVSNAANASNPQNTTAGNRTTTVSNPTNGTANPPVGNVSTPNVPNVTSNTSIPSSPSNAPNASNPTASIPPLPSVAVNVANLSAACAVLVTKATADPTSYFQKALSGQLNWTSSLVAFSFQQLPDVATFSNGSSTVVLIRGDRNQSDVAVNSSNGTVAFVFPRSPQPTNLVVTVTPPAAANVSLGSGVRLVTDVLEVLRFNATGAPVTQAPFNFSLLVPGVTSLKVFRTTTDGMGPRSVSAEGGLVLPANASGWWNITAVGTSAFIGTDVTANFSVSLWPLNRGVTARLTLALRPNATVWLGNQLRVTLPPDFVLNRCDDGYASCPTQTELRLLDSNAVVPLVAKLVTPGPYLQLAGNLTLAGPAQIVLTNVSLPNHCNDATYLVQADYCQADQWGARVCTAQPPVFAATYSAATDVDGVPQGCSVCNACRAHPAGFLQCAAGPRTFWAPTSSLAATCSG